jgi:hypothetical protein
MHSYRSAQAVGSNLRIMPGQAELAAIRFVLVIALIGSLVGVLV